MYDHVKRIKKIVEDKNIKFTELKHERSFDEWFFEYEPKRRKPEEFKAKYGEVKGLSWGDHKTRWCTKYLKT